MRLIQPRTIFTMKRGFRENAERLNKAFAWNKGFREYFAVKATPNPFIIDILKRQEAARTVPHLQSL